MAEDAGAVTGRGAAAAEYRAQHAAQVEPTAAAGSAAGTPEMVTLQCVEQ